MLNLLFESTKIAFLLLFVMLICNIHNNNIDIIIKNKRVNIHRLLSIFHKLSAGCPSTERSLDYLVNSLWIVDIGFDVKGRIRKADRNVSPIS